MDNVDKIIHMESVIRVIINTTEQEDYANSMTVFSPSYSLKVGLQADEKVCKKSDKLKNKYRRMVNMDNGNVKVTLILE